MNVLVSADKLFSGVAAQLRDARAARGYTLEDVAVTSGLTIAEVEALETGRSLDARRLARFAAAVGISISHLSNS
ncbi:helix-turn-helix domain-containing protein [Rhizobium sp. 2MFCol3.1]|uniref:helix-turn-helix domain-containing protein n=1 Tax=Rhizobium sp. 2MFCol3.1 TaxID=1246459 RepID=UPI0003724DC9|nr:helix-turn-helix domain-containing protein [Rhizobium sp. 2MFCol3.1]